MGQGWKVDVAASQTIVDAAARAASSMQDAAIDVDAALRSVVTALVGSEPVGAAQAFATARRGDVTAAARGIERAISAATGAMTAFAHADAEMASDTVAAAERTDERGPS